MDPKDFETLAGTDYRGVRCAKLRCNTSSQNEW